MPIGIYKRTKEHSRNLSKALKGRKFTDEWKANLSKNSAIKGKKLSLEVKRKISESLKGRIGREWSEEERKKASERMMGSVPWNKGKNMVHSGSFKKGVGSRQYIDRLPREENHYMWKGEDAGYSTKHKWLYRVAGKANKCENPNCKHNAKAYNWANISHEYKRNLLDWIMLCGSCHYKYDRGSTEQKTVISWLYKSKRENIAKLLN